MSSTECRQNCDVYKDWCKLEAENASLIQDIKNLEDSNEKLKEATKPSRCPCCGAKFIGQGYTKKSVHYACAGCGAQLEIDKKKWNKIIHPNLPKGGE